MKTRIWLALAATALAGCATPSGNGPFNQADLDHDGYVSLNEWRASGGQDLAFVTVDRKHRGRLTESEFNEARLLNAGAQADALAAQQAYDSQLTQAVKAALVGQRNINGWAIRVETYQGNVQLSGTLRTPAEKQQAEEIARAVAGVRQVFNSIVLRD
jgi:hyperosmotically inducible protein